MASIMKELKREWSEENRTADTRQWNYCVSLLRKTKTNYLNHKDLANNKKLWRIVKHLLSDKLKSNEKITLVESWKIFKEDEKTAETLILFFHLLLKILIFLIHYQEQFLIQFLSNLWNIKIIQVSLLTRVNRWGSFYFSHVTVYHVFKEIRKPNPRKINQATDIRMIL